MVRAVVVRSQTYSSLAASGSQAVPVLAAVQATRAVMVVTGACVQVSKVAVVLTLEGLVAVTMLVAIPAVPGPGWVMVGPEGVGW